MKLHIQIEDATPAEMAEVMRILFSGQGAPLLVPQLTTGPINLRAPIAPPQLHVTPGLNLSPGPSTGGTTTVVAEPARQVGPATSSSSQPEPMATSGLAVAVEGPGPDDSDAVFFRCNTFTAVVKVLVGRGLKTAEDILHAVAKLRGQGISVIDSIPDEKLADRVASSLVAAGVS